MFVCPGLVAVVAAAAATVFVIQDVSSEGACLLVALPHNDSNVSPFTEMQRKSTATSCQQGAFST